MIILIIIYDNIDNYDNSNEKFSVKIQNYMLSILN